MNTALNKTMVAIKTNESGVAHAQGDVCVEDDSNANSVVNNTGGAFVDGGVWVCIEPAGVADGALGRYANMGYVPKINLSASASLGDLVRTHTVAKQGVPHAAPIGAGDFAQVLDTGTTPEAWLFGLPNQGGGGMAEVDPTSITGCILWMDANQESNVDGDLIATWSDRSASNNDAVQATGGNKPTFRENVFNGKPALFFDGGDHLTLGTNITADPATVIIVANQFARNSYDALLTVSKFGVYAYLNSAACWGVHNNAERSAGARATHQPFIATVLYNGPTDITFFTNGQRLVGGGGSNSAGANSYIGWDSGASQQHYGYIAEAIIFDNIISGADQLALRNWLAFKWGIPGT